MDSQQYTAEDLALNVQFQQWIRGLQAVPHASWRSSAAARAIVLIRQAGLSPDAEANDAFLHVWNNIRTQIEDTSERSL